MPLPDALAPVLQLSIERLHAAAPEIMAAINAQPERLERLLRVLVASDYAADRLCRMPALLDEVDAGRNDLSLPTDAASTWPALLRRYRHAESVRLIHRDVNGIDALEETLVGTSQLAERCVAGALDALHASMARDFGVPRDAQGVAQRLVVFGLGKLGGSELNFSSDIDLVFGFAGAGQSDGARALDNNDWFQRLGQRLIQLLANIDAEGMVYRVDMRLRPFGQAGRLALSFAAMEQYFQREGRDWERYAWIKARPVAGDLAQGERFLESMRPFVYRRYLDFGAIEGLREMKAMIEAEVARKEREADLKLGCGGIREIEFIVQVLQMIRAGREPALRVRGLLPALARLRSAGHIPDTSAERLASAYRFLRRLENRVQMLREQQVHSVPEDALDRARLAWGLGFADWEALSKALNQHREHVASEFARVFAAHTQAPVRAAQVDLAAMAALWHEPQDADVIAQLQRAGFADGREAASRLRAFAGLNSLSNLSARARARLDRVLPKLLVAASGSGKADLVLERGLTLIQAILRRSSYLALLDEQPAALARLVDAIAASRWMAERLCSHPLLLDELLDARGLPDASVSEEATRLLQQAVAGVADDDLEARVLALNEVRQGVAFRIARAHLIEGRPAAACTRLLAELAQFVVAQIVPWAVADVARRHGVLRDGGMAVVAYGSFGGRELGFGSDLDLVFLHDADQNTQESDGDRALDAVRYHTRVVQKIINLLAMPTPAGSLYEVDLRLRPDGSKGLLVSSMQAFAAYQHERAWTWERQALVRARAVAGDARMVQAFEQIRAEVLCRGAAPERVREEARTMRQRMRAELDRSDGLKFDLKQGEGGLVDLEFLLQAGALICAPQRPAVTAHTHTLDLLGALAELGFVDEATASALRQAHAVLSARALACTLDARARLVPMDPDLSLARTAIIDAWRQTCSPSA
ncbi:MAG: bifunctional [glutamate--ammonia ligase]-adenylyl-L-tyrosine phosphorylase/[glutamate--ammonia-ligase] adenylyltransferase [Xanthomonadales bacterium]|nr:bifunctional [glutamate--ammonia ligase]-adenylyl-L-tyrosine phosphorylase/[glutamate--ammonia-ligase] adenylyltransferase [Xanthomonadales bacterium]